MVFKGFRLHRGQISANQGHNSKLVLEGIIKALISKSNGSRVVIKLMDQTQLFVNFKGI